MNLSKTLYRYGRDPVSIALLVCVFVSAVVTFMSLAFLLGYILMQGIPNINLDLFAFEYNTQNVSLFPALVDFFVTYLKWSYSLLAGSCTVAIMILPLIMRTTEEALKAIPDSYREGSYGLGAGKLRTVFAIVLPSAIPGILAGVILGIGRIVGETAALMYTSGTVAALPHDVFSSGRTLAVHMYVLASEGLFMKQAYATAVILVVIVIAINAVSSYMARKLMKGN